MINLEIRKYIECTPEEKQPLLKKIAELINLANIARKEGVLALEQRIEKTDDSLIKIGLGLIVDGTDPELVGDILRTTVVTSNKTGAELLSQLVVMDGLLLLQAGNNPRIIEAKLMAYMGDANVNDCAFNMDRYLHAEYTILMEDIKNWEKTTGLPELEALLKSSNRDTQCILREVDQRDLTIALRGFSFELKEHFLKNLSKRLCVQILNDMKFMGQLSPEDIAEAQQEIVNIAHRLHESGEIIISKG